MLLSSIYRGIRSQERALMTRRRLYRIGGSSAAQMQLYCSCSNAQMLQYEQMTVYTRCVYFVSEKKCGYEYQLEISKAAYSSQVAVGNNYATVRDEQPHVIRAGQSSVIILWMLALASAGGSGTVRAGVWLVQISLRLSRCSRSLDDDRYPQCPLKPPRNA